MTRLVRFNTFGAFEPFFRFPYMPEEIQSAAWNPPVDVVEQKDRILVKVEAPGVDEKDLRVTFEDGLLTISGERQFERKDDSNYHRIERAYGSFSRSLRLPRSVDAMQIAANYRNGVLEIEIPKKEESRPRQIEINVNAAKAIEG
jgi:HSP20 family protein